MEHQTLNKILESAAESVPSNGLIIYPLGATTVPVEISYFDLLQKAQQYSTCLKETEGFKTDAPIVIHLNDHLDTIVWFWAVIYSRAIPTITTPFSNIPEQRPQFIQGLSDVLENPLCITRESLLDSFDGHQGLQIHTIESLKSITKGKIRPDDKVDHGGAREDDLAMLMLTSGSTGNAKAVRLTHKQVIAAVNGKAFFRTLPAGKPLLNWIGFDHVASVVEIHLPAMLLGVNQIHVQAADLIAIPTIFLDLLSQHKVSRTFAPNFFMAKLISTVRPGGKMSIVEEWDLSSLTWMGSGGEANDVEVCVALTSLFTKCGTASNVIVPGFGMTETCAGCIYNLECPEYDLECHNTFTALGTCIPGAQMRTTLSATCDSATDLAKPGEAGNLEVAGEVVFEGYYRNPEATAEAFTLDGWFKTGDQAIIDANGNLHMIGRTKETININGVKYLPQDIEVDVEQSLPPDACRRIICFPVRDSGAQTEGICIAYVAASEHTPPKELVTIHDTIVQRVMLQTGTRTYVLALRNEALLPKSTLGKISRAKMQSMFEGGLFADEAEWHDSALSAYRMESQRSQDGEASNITDMERLLLLDFASVLGTPKGMEHWSVDIPIFDVGATSIDLIRLKKRIGMGLKIDIPVITLMLNPTARALANALRPLTQPSTSGSNSSANSVSSSEGTEYNPVVTLRPAGPCATKSPLWLVHPGVGEVLVFLGLAKHLQDRPVHALRARGFEPGEEYFSSIEEAVSTYHAAIKKVQPSGPYALAGYSYGTMLAFEVAKRMEQSGDEIRFLGSFNLPPHIKYRMRQLGWAACFLHLSYFLGLLTEDKAGEMQPAIERMDAGGDREGALRTVLGSCDRKRLEELQLDGAALANWAMLAHKLQGMAKDYEPGGSVGVMDVFHAIPLKEAAKDREDWVQNHLANWREFVRTEPVFYAVSGAHYTMLGPDYVESFAATLKKVLDGRCI